MDLRSGLASVGNKNAARKSGVDLLSGGNRQPSVSDSGALCAGVYTLIFLVYASGFRTNPQKYLGGSNQGLRQLLMR